METAGSTYGCRTRLARETARAVNANGDGRFDLWLSNPSCQKNRPGSAPAEKQPVRLIERSNSCCSDDACACQKNRPGSAPAEKQPVRLIERSNSCCSDDACACQKNRPRTGQRTPRPCNQGQDRGHRAHATKDRTEDTAPMQPRTGQRTPRPCNQGQDRGHRAHATNQCNSIPSLPLPTTNRTIETLPQWALSSFFDIPKQTRQTCSLGDLTVRSRYLSRIPYTNSQRLRTIPTAACKPRGAK